MSIASSLFFDSNDSEKQTLNKRITPSSEQFNEQQERWNDLADYLTTRLRERSGYAIRTWLQGSYKFGTQVRPSRGGEFDIDMGVYFLWKGNSEDGNYEPSVLRSFVQSALEKYSLSHSDEIIEVTSPKTRCCRIRYKNNFHIDVPVYHLNDDSDNRRLATDRGWEDSDPKAIYLWFRDSFEDQARRKIRRQVRYVKAWSALNFQEELESPSSILLTVLVAEAAKKLDPSKIKSEDETLYTLLGEIVSRLDNYKDVYNPVNEEENLSRFSDEEMDKFIENLRSFFKVAERAVKQESTFSAADIWQEAFYHMFPFPDTFVEASSKFLPVPVTLPEISVSAVAKNNPSLRFTGKNKIGPIPKDCNIEFKVTNPESFPAGSEVFWMVRNEGREAENTNDLGHSAGKGLDGSEYSAYRGTHYMDCIVKVLGRTVTMRRVPVIISGIEAPRRNPKKKPSWVPRLRGRR